MVCSRGAEHYSTTACGGANVATHYFTTACGVTSHGKAAIPSLIKILLPFAFRGQIICRTRADEFTEARECEPPGRESVLFSLAVYASAAAHYFGIVYGVLSRSRALLYHRLRWRVPRFSNLSSGSEYSEERSDPRTRKRPFLITKNNSKKGGKSACFFPRHGVNCALES